MTLRTFVEIMTSDPANPGGATAVFEQFARSQEGDAQILESEISGICANCLASCDGSKTINYKDGLAVVARGNHPDIFTPDGDAKCVEV